jgi:glycosyltransferase involved in cell wall biosynthesis
MKVLVLSTDRKLLDKESAVYARHKKYAEHFDNFVVLCSGGRGVVHDEKIDVYGVGRLASFFKSLRLPRPDVITVQDPFENGLIGLAIAWWRGVPLHAQIHTDFLSKGFVEHSPLNRIRRIIARFVLPRASGIRLVSDGIKDSLTAESWKLKAIPTVLPIFVDTEKYADIARTKHPRFKIALLWIGRLEKEKCPLFAIQVLEIVRRQGHDAGLTIVGSGSEEELLKRYTRERGLERFVDFAGYQNDLSPYFSTADIMLVTSVYEGYGMAMVEALAAGIPVLSTDVGVGREAGAIVTERRRFGRALLDWIAHGPRKAELQSYPYASEKEYVMAWYDDVRSQKVQK